LQEAVAEQRNYLAVYEAPSANRAFETLRVLDDLNCRDLMFPGMTEEKERRYRSISSWGANHALRRIIPRTLSTEPFEPHSSSATIQAQADDFVFRCGVLALAERYEGWLREGVVDGDLRRHQIPGEDRERDVLVLRSATASYSDEEIGRAGLRWASDLIWRKDRPAERKLEREYLKLRGEMEKRVTLSNGWQMIYSSTPEIDEHFMEWAKLYLRRIFSQDLIGPEDRIGGRPFSRYIDVLTVMSAWSQKHTAYAAILGGRYGVAQIRNLLTTCAGRDRYVSAIARAVDAHKDEVSEILRSFVLVNDNLDIHTKGGDPTWAPIVQASQDTLLLPVYGIDINPFLFLLTDLRARYERDWFRVANERERRWIAELEASFQGSRYNTHGQNPRLREQGKDVTDIDFAVLDRKTGELGLFQLKWQHPVGMDNRGRRSTGRNLVLESNRWVQAVCGWLDRHGLDELLRRLRFEGVDSPSVHLFVLGRYQVHITGFDGRDGRATWSDWGHFRRAKEEGHRRSISQIAGALRSILARATAEKGGEALMIPVGELRVVLNPSSQLLSPGA
jgi:hypothetical protein